ncbi:MAG TPA: polyprenyl synthetase family protein [Thermomicrobiales bacterium]|nr:polyprenyl synthetase family protein [Thermomicrobiales bacterium]
MVELQTRDVFTAMRPDLQRVEARVEQAAAIDMPLVSSLVLDLVRAGGKRLRPLILLLAGRAYDYDLDALSTAAAGVELLHTASLVHDDTVDRAALRRGKPTLNAVLNSGAVILLGDYLFAQSAILAAATGSPRVVAIFASTLADICDGQLQEMFNAHRLDQTREEYERRIYGKTASLFAGAAEMGALIGAAPEPHVAALRSFGADIGMAFQIVDDVLDLREGTQQLGKPTGNDIRQGTVTLPTMLYDAGLDAGSADAKFLRAVVAGDLDGPEVDGLVRAIRDSGALEQAMSVAGEYAERAKTHAAIVPDGDTRRMLFELADLALARSS